MREINAYAHMSKRMKRADLYTSIPAVIEEFVNVIKINMIKRWAKVKAKEYLYSINSLALKFVAKNAR